MLCCCQVPTIEEPKPLIVDLHKILCDKAWSTYKSSLGPFRRLCLNRKSFVIEVPENYFLLEQMEQNVTPRGNRLHIIMPGTSDETATKNNNSSNSSNQIPLAAKMAPNKDLANPEAVSLDTEFSNDTASAQTYKFRFEKQRRTEVTVSFQKGFTLGGKANFTVGLPVGGAETGAEGTMQYQVTKSEGQKFEESMLMEATSDISVGPHSQYVAQVQLEEKRVISDFRVRMRMSMPQGRAPVYVKRKSDQELVGLYSAKNLKDIFVGVVSCAREVTDENGQGAADKVDFVVEGVITGNVACNHRIQLTSDEPLGDKQGARVRYLQATEPRSA